MSEYFDPYAAPARPARIVRQGSRGGWGPGYPIAMLLGAFCLDSALIHAIRDENLGGPAPGVMILFLLAVATVIGALGGLLLVGSAHLLSRLFRRRPP